MCDSGAIGSTFDQARKSLKRFGEFEYFGDFDVMNKLNVGSLMRYNVP